MIRNIDYAIGGKLTSRPPKEYVRVSSLREFEKATPEERRVGTYVSSNNNRAIVGEMVSNTVVKVKKSTTTIKEATHA